MGFYGHADSVSFWLASHSSTMPPPLLPKFGGCALLSDLFLDLSRGDPHDAHAIADHFHRAVLTFWSLGHTPIVTRLLSMAKRDGYQTETLPNFR